MVLLVLTLIVVMTQGLPVTAQESHPIRLALTQRQAEHTAAHDADVATAWFDLSLKLVRETPGFSPPVAARAFGYLGVALYETVRPGMPGYHSLAGQLNELDQLPRTYRWARYHWPAAANTALASTMRMLFPTASAENLAAIDALEAEFEARYRAEATPIVYRRSVAWGQTMADAIYAWSLSDGGHEGYLHNFPGDYKAPVGVGLWEPTPPKYLTPMQPYWGDNRPFVLADGDACPIAPPPVYSKATGSLFYAEAMEVYAAVKATDPEHVAIATFWADDPGKTATPPGHWVSILNQVIEQEDAGLAQASEGYAKLGIALADAFITCWHTKFEYNVVRPITYIQQVIDPSWNMPQVNDPVTTPPFPEYPSGHSVQSGAAAAVLTDLFGADYAFTDETHMSLGLAARTYDSFHAAAAEAAISRLYGGIHYRAAIENGLVQGDCVAEQVLSLRFGPS